MRQLVESEKSLSRTLYDKKKQALIQSIDVQSSHEGWRYSENFNPFPVKLEAGFQAQLLSFQSVLIQAIQVIVKHYGVDSRIRNRICLPKEVVDLLELANDKPYQIGTLRPDFIFDHDGSIKVCEINARFSMNGLLLNEYIGKFYQADKSTATKKLTALVSKHFDIDRPIRILKGCEKGYDIHCLMHEFENMGVDIGRQMVMPSSLAVIDGNLCVDGMPCDQYILELHQHELLALPKSVQHALIKSSHLNDIRTIFIAHDKRLLSVLCDRLIMRDYLDKDQVDLLVSHVIPTFTVTDKIISQILSYPEGWVMKKYLSGKGEGMLIGRESDCNQLRTTLNENGHAYIAQKYINQKKYPVLNPKSDVLEFVDKNWVGFVYSFDDQPLGPGFFRSGLSSVVNLSTQGSEIIGVV